MAHFSPSDFQCEEPHCASHGGSKDIASYGVRETRNFCSSCAEKKHHEGVILPRGDRRRTTFCAGHGERLAKWYCASHNAAVCQDCRSSSTHQSCTLKDVEYALKETTFLLQKSLTRVGLKQEEFRRQDAMLHKRSADMDTHFKGIKEAIKAAQKEKDRSRRGKTKPTGATARGPEYDHRTNADIDDKERERDDQEAGECLEQTNEGYRRANRLVMTVKEQCKRGLEETKAAAEKIEQLLLDDYRSMGDIKSTIAALEDKLKLSVDTHLLDIAEEFTRGIKYVRRSDSYIGRVEGCRRSLWYLSDTIILPQKIEEPRVRCIDNAEVVVLDVKDKGVYHVNLQNKECRRLEDERPIADIISWQDGKIVCIDDGGLAMSVFSRQWQYHHDISHPGLVFENLAVGSRGNLLVRTNGQRIYAIKPTDGGIQPKNYISINIDNIKEVVALPSGHIIVKQHKSTFIVLNGKGSQVMMMNQKHWEEANVAVDRSTGTPYVLYLDSKRKDFALCWISISGADVVEEEVLGLHHLLDSSLPFHIDVFGSYKLYICNGSKLFVFTMMRADDP